MNLLASTHILTIMCVDLCTTLPCVKSQKHCDVTGVTMRGNLTDHPTIQVDVAELKSVDEAIRK